MSDTTGEPEGGKAEEKPAKPPDGSMEIASNDVPTTSQDDPLGDYIHRG
jgi:hypothetical protein